MNISRPTGSVWVDLGRKVVTADHLQHEDISLKRLSVSLDGADVDSFEKSLSPENLLGGGSPDLEALSKAQLELRDCEFSVGPKTQARLRSLMKTGLAGLPPFVASAILSSFQGDEGLTIQLSARREELKEVKPTLNFGDGQLKAGGIQYKDFQLQNMELQLPGVEQRMGTILQGLNFEQRPTKDVVEPLKDQTVGLDEIRVGMGPQIQGAVRSTLVEALKANGVPALDGLLNNTLNGDPLALRLSVTQGQGPRQKTLVMPPDFERGVHINLERGELNLKNVQAGALGIDEFSTEIPRANELLGRELSLQKLVDSKEPEIGSLDGLLPIKTNDFQVRIGQATLDGIREKFLNSDRLKEFKIKPEKDGKFSFAGKASAVWDFDFGGEGQLGCTEDGKVAVTLDDFKFPGVPSLLIRKLKGPLMEMLTPQTEGVEVENSTIKLDPSAFLPEGVDMKLGNVTTRDGEVVLASKPS